MLCLRIIQQVQYLSKLEFRLFAVKINSNTSANAGNMHLQCFATLSL